MAYFILLCIGHINHSLFWTNLAPINSGGGKLAPGPLESAFVRDFGSFDEFKKIFNTTTAAVQGSGWGWLVRLFCLFFYDKSEILYMGQGFEKFSRRLEVVTTSNQDPLLCMSFLVTVVNGLKFTLLRSSPYPYHRC